MGYPNRRYRVVDSKLAKRWDEAGTTDPEWFVTKVEAWAAEEVRIKKAAGLAKTAAARAAKAQKDKDVLAAKEAKAAAEEAERKAAEEAEAAEVVDEPVEQVAGDGSVITDEDVEAATGDDYESWSGARLLSEIETRTLGAGSSKAGMIERLRDNDAQRARRPKPEAEAEVVEEAEAGPEEVVGGGKPVVIPPAETAE